MKLRKDYAQIAEMEYERWEASHDAVREVCDKVALACQALADRPPRELSDAEIQHIFDTDAGLIGTSYPSAKWFKGIRAVIAAAHAKQRQPEVVKFRAYRDRMEGKIWMARVDADLAPGLEWLEPAQEFEVKLP